MEHEHTQHVAAPADRVFAALADVDNLPRYVPQMTEARQTGDDTVAVEARYGGHTQQGEGWFRRDESQRRIEWGARGGDYHGWLQVAPDAGGSRLTLFLATPHPASDSDVMGTLDAIRRLVEADT
ncbi:MAG: SRPBCC family protein [Solirubrobacteraceae bacterium]